MTVVVSDGKDNQDNADPAVDATIEVTINLIDVDQPQARPAAPTVERLRTSTAGETGLTVTWTAPEIPGISGYEVLYREQGEQEWNDYGSLIGSSATSVDMTGLSTGTIYEAQWRARNGGSSGTICPEETACDNGGNTSLWSETGSARTNRPPQESHLYNDQNHPVSEAQKVNILDRHSVAQTGPVFTDPDGDLMLLTVSSEYPGLVSASLLDAGRNIRAEAENPGSSRISYSVSDGYGGSASGSFVFTGHRSVTLQIPENSPGGAGVGTPVTGRPYQGGTLTYSLTGAAAAKFAIDSATGQIRLREGSSLDHETGPNTFTGQVEYTVGGRRCRGERHH